MDDVRVDADGREVKAETPPEEKWMPTQAGTTFAYEPEWRGKRTGGEWREVEHVRQPREKGGFRYPFMCGGVIEQIGLLGRAQAWAIAWAWAADAESCGEEIEVRVAQYEVRFDIKARKLAVALTSE